MWDILLVFTAAADVKAQNKYTLWSYNLSQKKKGSMYLDTRDFKLGLKSKSEIIFRCYICASNVILNVNQSIETIFKKEYRSEIHLDK